MKDNEIEFRRKKIKIKYTTTESEKKNPNLVLSVPGDHSLFMKYLVRKKTVQLRDK